MDYSEKSKSQLTFLDKNPSTYKLFEELVVKHRIVTPAQFFGDRSELASSLQKAGVANEDIDTILQFISFDKVKVEDRDLVLFTQEDKELLLNNFPEIRKLYESHNFDKFKDRKHEEALFWNDFFKNQYEQNSFLYGNSLDEKKVRKELPRFINGQLQKQPVELDLDIYNNLEDVKNNENHDKYISVGNIDTNDLIGTINNHSLAILYKNVNPEIEAELQMKGKSTKKKNLKLETEEFELVESHRKHMVEEEILEPVSPIQRRGSFNLKHSTRENQSGNPQLLETYHHLINGVERKLSEKKLNGNVTDFFNSSDHSSNSKIVAIINEQIRKAEEAEQNEKRNLEDYYSTEFLSKYKEINKKAKLLLKVFYSQFPIDVQADKEKIGVTLSQLSMVVDELKMFKGHVSEKYKDSQMKAYIGALNMLETLISRAIVKVKRTS